MDGDQRSHKRIQHLEIFTSTGMSNNYSLKKQYLLCANYSPISAAAYNFRAIKPTPMMSEDTGSDQALAQISHWLQECVDGHQHCNHIQFPTLLPKRLV
jgi:hypothetical protein